MNRLTRYTALFMVVVSLSILGVLMGLAALFTLIDELRSVETPPLQAALHTLLDVPRFLRDTLAIAALAGCTIALALLARSRELLIMQAELGQRRLLYAALLPGLLAAAVALLNTEYLLPFAAELERGQRLRAEPDPGDGLRWFRAGSRHVHVERILPGSRLEGIRVYEYHPDSTRLVGISYADGAWFRRGQWVPEGLRRFTLDAAGQPTAAARDWYLPIPERIGAVRSAPESLSMQFLYKHVRRLDGHGLDSTRYARAFWSKLLHLAALPLSGLLALALVLGALRSWPYVLKAGLGGLIGVAYYAVDHTAYYLGLVHELPPLACAAVAPGLLLAATLVLLLRLRRPGGAARA